MQIQTPQQSAKSISAKPRVIFFGSFLEYSVKVLKALLEAHVSGKIELVGVVTTPPMPAGRKQELKKTPVHEFALGHGLEVFAPESLQGDFDYLPECEYFVTAGYGKLLPISWLTFPKLAALNIHFSLLPKYRGANPAEWALLAGETTSGISVIEMSPEFDTGAVLATVPIALEPTDTRESVYEKLYDLAEKTAVTILLTDYSWRMSGAEVTNSSNEQISFYFPPQVQVESPTPYARKLAKDDAWISAEFLQIGMGIFHGSVDGDAFSEPITQDMMSPFLWEQWQFAQKGQASAKKISPAAFLERAVRALVGFPCVWTEVETSKGTKRLKIFSAKVVKSALMLEEVQLEGQQKSQWNQIKNSIL